ncbi:hypothetical protein QP735_04245 [Curtobacterium citreum]|nr:hypothetical protein [Curtobacterium citreum]MDK8171734.1 hypothetical protein [Curtobacterium citreum]
MSENETPKWLTPPTRADLERAFARIDVVAEIEKARAALAEKESAGDDA